MQRLETPSRPSNPFEPESLEKYTVIRIPFRFGTSAITESKRFVLIGHKDGYAICIKATSKVTIYVNNPEKMAGCVFYKANEVPQFGRDTVIQPENQVPIPHSYLLEKYNSCEVDDFGVLPEDFEQRLIEAITKSTTITSRKAERLIEMLRC